MGDQGVFFKLWCSAEDDPDLGILTVADYGRWCKFGTYTKKHGVNGVLRLTPPADGVAHPLQQKLQLPTFDDVLICIQKFTTCNVSVATTPVVSYLVVWRNWAKYQGDYSTPRVQAWRIRHVTSVTEMKQQKKKPPLLPSDSPLLSEKKSDNPSVVSPGHHETSAVVSHASDALPPWISDLPFPAWPATWWQQIFRLFPGLDHEAVARDAAAYWVEHRAKYREPRRFLRNQYSRAFSRARDAAAQADPYAALPCYTDRDIGPDGMPTPEARQREAVRIARVKAGRRS